MTTLKRIVDIARTRWLMLSARGMIQSVTSAGALSVALLTTPGYAMAEAAANASAPAPDRTQRSATEDTSIRRFRINVSQAPLDDLRQRVLTTRWPDKETVNDQSQGPQLAKIQALAQYWGTQYDWRKVEAKLNSLPQFVTMILAWKSLRSRSGELPFGSSAGVHSAIAVRARQSS
jgi:Epoxide hydrolase N terminus